jgi:WD40 repeat protein
MKASGWVLHSQHESTTTLPCFICCSLNKWFDKIRRSYSLGKEWSFVIMSFFVLCCLPFMLPKNWCFFLTTFSYDPLCVNLYCIQGGALSTLVGHTQCVSSVYWPEPNTIYSASWDHSVRRWDVEMGKDLSNIVCDSLTLPLSLLFSLTCLVNAC